MRWSNGSPPPEKGAFKLYLSVLDPKDIEVLQSAEIVYRELSAYGVSVLLDDRNASPETKLEASCAIDAPIRLEIGSRGLETGDVDLFVPSDDGARERKITVKLEDSVEKTVETIRELEL